jgi:site-specific recombinase XerD
MRVPSTIVTVRVIAPFLADAKLPKMRIHDLRHPFATILLIQGANMRMVMDLLGHSQVNLMLDTYSHILPAMRKEAAQQMDAVLGA